MQPHGAKGPSKTIGSRSRSAHVRSAANAGTARTARILSSTTAVVSTGVAIAATITTIALPAQAHDPRIVAIMGVLIAIAALSAGHRLPVAALVAFVVVVLAVGNLFLDDHVSAAVTAASGLTVVTSALVIPRRHLKPTLTLAATIWFFGVLTLGADHENGFTATFWLSIAVQLAAMGAALTTIASARNQLDLSIEHARHLFYAAPVGLWQNDFSAVAAWFGRLRRRGVEDLSDYLGKHPDALGRAIQRVSVSATNPAAMYMLGGLAVMPASPRFDPGLLRPDALETFREQLTSMWGGALSGERIITDTRLDGRPLHAILRWSIPTTNGVPDMSRVLVAVTDITPIREAEQRRRAGDAQHKAICETATAAIVTSDANGIIRSWNRSAEVMFGHTTRQACGLPLTRLVRDLPAEAHSSHRIDAGDNHRGVEPIETIAIHRDGSEFPIELSLSSWTDDDGATFHAAIMHDITERVNARRAMRKTTEDLEGLLRSKDELIASVAHELRTPLSIIFGYAALLAEGDSGLAQAELAEIYATMAEQGADLSNIIDDLLVAARGHLETIPIGAEPIDLVGTVASTLEDAKIDIPVEICGPQENFATGDRHRVRQIIRNLVANAKRHGGDECRIEIGGDDVTRRITVLDNGPGVPLGREEEIFEPFMTASMGEANPASVGVGLTVSRRLARLMGGDLTYQRTAGTTRFTLALPVHPGTERKAICAASLSPTVAPAVLDDATPQIVSRFDEAAELQATAPMAVDHGKGVVLEVVGDGRGAMRDDLERVGHTVVRCHMPTRGACPLAEGQRCGLVELASGVVFELDLADDYSRKILDRYRSEFENMLPLRVAGAVNLGKAPPDVAFLEHDDRALNRFSWEVGMADLAKSAA